MNTVTSVDNGRRRVARRVLVPTDPGEIFSLLADPHRHEELDGSGTVRAAASGPSHLRLGDRFSVNMRQLGIPYRITSQVVAIEQDRLIEWRHPLGHTWRWELAYDGGGTVVTETFDYSRSWAARMYEWSGRVERNGRGITATLRQLCERFADR